MKTEVIMKRKLFDGEISQKHKSTYLSATDLLKVGNKWRVANKMQIVKFQDWKKTKQTKEFIATLEAELNEKVIITARGRGKHTWVHPYIFIDLALSINPKFKIEVYSWLYDELLKYRNYSGDSYKKMAGALYNNSTNKSTFHRGMTITANMVKNACNVKDWQQATEEQLKLRDKIHENIALLCDVLRNNNDAIRIGINEALKYYNNGQ